MFSPSPGLWPGLIEDRRRRLSRMAPSRQPASARRIRVAVGHLLIAVGGALSGERVESAPRRPALPRSA
jgi:hypothetical protein